MCITRSRYSQSPPHCKTIFTHAAEKITTTSCTRSSPQIRHPLLCECLHCRSAGSCAEFPQYAIRQAFPLRVINDIGRLQLVARHAFHRTETVRQSQLHRLRTAPDKTRESFRHFLQTRTASLAHDVDELLMNFIQHVLRIQLLFFGLRTDRIEEALVFTCRQQAAFDTKLLHGAGETEAVHQHADR